MNWSTLYKIIFLVVLSGFAINSKAQDNAHKISNANALYQKGQYEQALKLYEQVGSSGQESASLYFNLGNTYFKINQFPQAILNYERALRLSPSDEDVQFNLRMANAKTLDKITPLPELFFKRWWKSLALSIAVDTWAIAAIVLVFITMFLAIGFVLADSAVRKRLSFVAIVATVLGVILTLSLASTAYNKQVNEQYAIVYAPSTYVKSSPDDKSTDLFILHEGCKVQIIDVLGSWQRIHLADGNEGWVKKETIAAI